MIRATPEISTLSLLAALPICAERIRDALQAAFPPAEVRVQDDSHRHAEHAGARPEGETHYSVLVVSPAFADRKSTRLNSSHANISYAVFCLKKKKKYP